MSSFLSPIKFLNVLRPAALWIFMSCHLLHSYQATAQDCDSPCDAIEALESYDIWVSESGSCAPVSATLTQNISEPICGDFEFHWEIQGGAFEWNEGSSAHDASPSITFLDAALYQVDLTVSAAGWPSCSVAISSSYFSVATIPTVSTSAGGEICAFDTWETLVYVNPGNSAISSFAWIVNGDSTISNSPAPLSMPFEEAGEIEIVAWVENTCGTSSDTTSVQVRALPSVSVDFDYSWICNGAPVQMNASGADNYTWNSSGTLISGGLTDDSTAVYEMQNSVIGGVEGSVNFGSLTCSASVGFQAYSFFVPLISIDGDELFCEGASVELQSTVSAFGYSTSSYWLFQDSLVEGNIFDFNDSDLNSDDYVVDAEVVFDPFPSWLQPDGCTGSAQFEFAIVELPEVEAPQGLMFCNQPILEPLPEGSPAGGFWEGDGVDAGMFNPVEIGLGSVSLQYSYADSNGCASMDTSIIQIHEPIWANAGLDSSICESSEWVNLVGFDEVESGVWSGPGLMDPYSGLVDAGELQVGQSLFIYEIGVGSCAASDTVIWTVMEHPVALLSTQGAFSCDGDTVWFQVYAGGGTLAEGNAYTNEWSEGVQYTSSGEPFVLADISQGLSSVSLEITDDEGCKDFDSVFIEPLELPEVTLPEVWSLCNQHIEVSAPPSEPQIGVWSGSEMVDSMGVFNPGLVGVGTHQLTFTATDLFGCTNTDSIQIEVAELDSISAGPDRSVCFGTSELILTGQFPPLSGWWSGVGVVDSLVPVIQTGGLTVGAHGLVFHTGVESCAQTDTMSIEVLPLPTATIDTASEFYCPGDTVTLMASFGVGSEGLVNDYILQWQGTNILFDDSLAFMLAPAVGPDTLFTLLEVIDSFGCSNEFQATYPINAPPVITVPEVLQACDQNIAIAFPEATPIGGTWESGIEGTMEGGQLIPGSFGVGEWPLIYHFVDSYGCAASDTTFLEIDGLPVLDLVPELSVCLNATAIELPTPESPSGVWFGPGVENESVAALNPASLGAGQFEYTFTSGEASCLVVNSVLLTVNALPVISLPAESSFCQGDSEALLPFASPDGGTWNGFGILDSIAGMFDSAIEEGAWGVQYEVEDAVTSCVNSVGHTVNIHSLPVAQFPSIDVQCLGELLSIQSTSEAAETHAWWLGDSLLSSTPEVTVLMETEGVLDLSLQVSNQWGCADTTIQSLSWIGPPSADFTLTEGAGCAPLSLGVINESDGVNDAIVWSLDAQTISLSAGDSLVLEEASPTDGFTLQMEVSNQCGTSVASDTIVVSSAPSVELSSIAESACSPFQSDFEFDISGSPEVLTWDFGNGEVGNGNNPVWPTFEANNVSILFAVSLLVSNACGSAVDSVFVWVEPSTVHSQFELDLLEGCAPFQITATDESLGGDAIALDFGSGSFLMDSTAIHTYSEAGEYTVIQIVSSACATDTFAVDVTVHPAFELELVTTTGTTCLGDSIAIDSNASDLATDVAIEWMTPSGVQTALAPITIGLDSLGLLGVYAHAMDTLNGCMAEDSMEIMVHSPIAIVVAAQVSTGCSPLDVAFDNQTEGLGTWSWSVGGGETSSNALEPTLNLIHQGYMADTVDVEVSVVSEWGCTSFDTIAIEVLPSPVFAFDLQDSVLCGVPAQIEPFIFAEDGLQMAWLVDSILVATTGTTVLEIGTLGHHLIELMGVNDFGCSGYKMDSIEVLSVPLLSLSVGSSIGCAPYVLEIEHDVFGANEWLLEIHADSTLVFASDENITEVLLETPASYNLELTAVSDAGCIASVALTDSIIVLPSPMVDFIPDPYSGTVDAPDPLNSSWTFENTSDLGQSIWDFGDGELSSEWNANHSYDAAGFYEVLLTVINDFGCAQELMMTIEVLESLEVYVPTGFTPPEQGYADGINDGWRPVLSDPDLVERYELAVYNRYGQLVWNTQDVNSHWVGEARNGGDYFAPGGIYTWVLQIDSRAFSELTRQWQGQVNLLR